MMTNRKLFAFIPESPMPIGICRDLFLLTVLSSFLLSCTSPNNSQPGPTKPATPTGILAAAGDSHVLVSWKSVSGATSYFLIKN
jgi:hypothetical protein